MNASSLNVATAVQQYLDENGFTVDEYTRPWVELTIGPMKLRMRNGAARQRAIPLHDMHHVATGYGTDLLGEAEIGAWELRAGCNNAFLVGINLTAAVLGAVLSPRRVWRAWRAARGARSLYVSGRSREALAAMSVAELRTLTGVPEGGVAAATGRSSTAHSAPESHLAPGDDSAQRGGSRLEDGPRAAQSPRSAHR
ncbi:MAG: hypothetical protein IPJ65_29480 [Archangiaceae bacterium]|nr:hypothetical protein [Archangiaceae bacterium]